MREGAAKAEENTHRILGEPLLHFDEIGSTNDAAVIAAQEGAPEGMVFAADRQTIGRGRKERRWHSEKGMGLYFSLILKPEFAAREVNRLVVQSAVAMSEAIEALTAVPVGLKWPNDLYMKGRKLGGILLETSITSQVINYAVLGVGVNLMQDKEDFPAELRGSAVSLFSATGIAVEAEELLYKFLQKMEEYYFGRKECSIREWTRRCVHLGKEVTLHLEGKKVEGEFAEVYGDLSFLLRTQDGEERRYHYGEISLKTEGATDAAGS